MKKYLEEKGTITELKIIPTGIKEDDFGGLF